MESMGPSSKLICPVCEIGKFRHEFPSDRVSLCKLCYSIQDKEYKRSLKGLPSKMYSNQLLSSRTRCHPKPSYSLKEFRLWLLAEPSYPGLHEAWVNSGYARDLVPSCDRLEDDKPYTFDNIQLTTAKLNLRKQSKQRKYGEDTRVCKAVIQMDLRGVFVEEFYSIAEAERMVPNAHNIQECIVGRRGRKQTAGFTWKYKEKNNG